MLSFEFPTYLNWWNGELRHSRETAISANNMKQLTEDTHTDTHRALRPRLPFSHLFLFHLTSDLPCCICTFATYACLRYIGVFKTNKWCVLRNGCWAIPAKVSLSSLSSPVDWQARVTLWLEMWVRASCKKYFWNPGRSISKAVGNSAKLISAAFKTRITEVNCVTLGF